jgi:tripartite-type tricarboxylate transporter receptor subunit TctC
MRKSASIVTMGFLGISLLIAQQTLAQPYPNKPIKMIVPIGAGSLTDIVGRAVAQGVSQAWGQPIVADNRAGANGTIGMEECMRSPSDGYTICMTDGNIMTLNPYAYTKLGYDPNAFTPVAHLAELEVQTVIKATLPVKSLKEFIEYAKARPGQVNWGSAGAGSTMHLIMEWMQSRTGAKFNHIPYKGPAQLQAAMAAGEIDITNLAPAAVAGYVKEGRIRPIAVITGKRRSQFAGDTPTYADQGFDLDFRNWLAIVLPPKTPMELARRWNTEINKLLSDNAFATKFLYGNALTPTGGTPEDLVTIMKAKSQLGAEMAKIANLKYD